MEVSASVGFVNTRPPRLEDAGLEDCALPAHAIQEAFRRAADAVVNVSSAATGALGRKYGHEPDDDCTHNPGPTNGSWEDRCLGSSGIATLGGESCVETKAGGLIEEGRDLVVEGGEEIKEGRLVVGSEAGPKLGEHGCVGEAVQKETPAPKEREAEREAGPILIGGLI